MGITGNVRTIALPLAGRFVWHSNNSFTPTTLASAMFYVQVNAQYAMATY